MENLQKLAKEDEDPGGCGQVLASPQKQSWLEGYHGSIKTIEDLDQYLCLKEDEKTALKQVAKKFHIRIPAYYLSLIKDKNDVFDPIRRQCVPSPEELAADHYEQIDPLAEVKTSPVPCLVHRYPDRALLLVTGRCFMYCRHCTRKRLWCARIQEPTLKDIELALSYVKANLKIREIIISGGDPLTLADDRLDCILAMVARLDHIQAVRLGTRAPVVLPQRITKSLCEVLGKYDKLWINVQFNHPSEITEQSTAACRKLQALGIPLSNQSVLLKGVNDSASVMTELCRRLQSIRVRPYYLFQCDPVVGTSHFRTSLLKGIEIIEQMQGHTGGMCVPTFVVDGTGGKGKIPLGPNYLLSLSQDGAWLRSWRNEVFFYRGGTAR